MDNCVNRLCSSKVRVSLTENIKLFLNDGQKLSTLKPCYMSIMLCENYCIAIY